MKTPLAASSATDCKAQSLLFQDLGSRHVVADFSGGTLSTDAGALLRREVDANLGLTQRLAQCFDDGRNQVWVEHSVPQMLAQRIYGLAYAFVGDFPLWAQLRTADHEAAHGVVPALEKIVAAIRQRCRKARIIVRGDTLRDRMQDTAKELNLTDEQKNKLQVIIRGQAEKLRDLRQDTSLAPEDKKEKLRALREEITAEVKKVLTPEQFEKWRAKQGQLAAVGGAPLARVQEAIKDLNLTDQQPEQLKPVYQVHLRSLYFL